MPADGAAAPRRRVDLVANHNPALVVRTIAAIDPLINSSISVHPAITPVRDRPQAIPGHGAPASVIT